MVKQLRMRRFYSDYFYWFTMQQYLYKTETRFHSIKKKQLFQYPPVNHKCQINLLKILSMLLSSLRCFSIQERNLNTASKDGMCSSATEHVCAYSKVWLTYQWTQRFHKKEQTFCGLKGLVLDDTPVSRGSWRAFCMQNCCRSAAA